MHKPNRHERRKAKKQKHTLGKRSIFPPSHLCLEQNPLPSRRFFYELREAVNSKEALELSIELGRLEKLGFATAIALTAECERLAKIQKKLLKNHPPPQGLYPEGVHMLYSVGFFDLVTHNPETIPSWPEKHWLPTQSGHKALPDLIDMLKDKLLSFSKKNWGTGAFNLPLIEVIANTLEHAYPNLPTRKFPEFKLFKEKRWWVSAELDENKGELELVCIDLGITIPKSIEFFHKDIPSPDSVNDIHRLFWACSPNKSGTNKSYRGKGLSEIIRPIEHNTENTVTIISGHAGAFFSQGITGKGEGSNFPFPYPGTLIKWHIKLTPKL